MADCDTPSKRASSVGVLVGFFLLAPKLPVGTTDQGDRQHIAWSYSGILAASGVVTPPTDRGYLLTKVDTADQGSEWRAPLTNVITFHAAYVDFTPGAGEAEFYSGNAIFRVAAVLDGAVCCRITVSGASSGIRAACQYSLDGGSSWGALDGGTGPEVTCASDIDVGSWVLLDAPAKADVLLRIVSSGGSLGHVQWGNVSVEFSTRDFS